MILHRKPVKVAVLTLGLAAIAALAATLALGGAQAGASTITVTKTEDTDGTCTLTDCSLREALKAADSGDGVIVPAGTYTLTLGTELVIDKSLSLNGDGPGQTIIQAAESSADATSRVLNITDGTATISGATIRHGKASGDGGGIASAATVILINTVVSNNIASTNGGGIRNFGGTLTATNTTLSGNMASGDGGGIASHGTLSLTNTTVSNNIASTNGGGIRTLRGYADHNQHLHKQKHGQR